MIGARLLAAHGADGDGESRLMRWVICALLTLAVPSGTRAADLSGDFDALRGSQSVGYAHYTRWSGFYVGGQIGEDFDSVNFRNLGTPELTTIAGLSSVFSGIPLTNFPRLGSLSTRAPSYSAFLGYNLQFESAVVGVELNFTNTSFKGGINDVESHSYFTSANGVTYDTAFTVTTGATAKVNDYASARGRFGWAFGNFLPYGFAGVSIAQINASKFVNVNVCGEETPLIAPTRRLRVTRRRRRGLAVTGRSPIRPPASGTSATRRDLAWITR